MVDVFKILQLPTFIVMYIFLNDVIHEKVLDERKIIKPVENGSEPLKQMKFEQDWKHCLEDEYVLF